MSHNTLNKSDALSYVIVTGTTYQMRDIFKSVGAKYASGKWTMKASTWDAIKSEVRGLNKKGREITAAINGCVASEESDVAQVIHPHALSKTGNNGYGPNSMAYDDV